MITHITIPALLLITSAMLVIAGLYLFTKTLLNWRK